MRAVPWAGVLTLVMVNACPSGSLSFSSTLMRIDSPSPVVAVSLVNCGDPLPGASMETSWFVRRVAMKRPRARMGDAPRPRSSSSYVPCSTSPSSITSPLRRMMRVTSRPLAFWVNVDEARLNEVTTPPLSAKLPVIGTGCVTTGVQDGHNVAVNAPLVRVMVKPRSIAP